MMCDIDEFGISILFCRHEHSPRVLLSCKSLMGMVWLTSLLLNNSVGVDGETTLHGPIEEIARKEFLEAEALLSELGIKVCFIAYC